MRLLMIDNYDSFTYNLYQYLGEMGAEVDVIRNDAETLESLLARDPDGVVISPGPGSPKKPVFRWRWSNALQPGAHLFSGYALGISRLASRTGGALSGRVPSCMGRLP